MAITLHSRRLAAEKDRPLNIKIASTFSDLNSYCADWNNLAVESAPMMPMLSHAWISSYFEKQLKLGERWLCLFAFDGDILVGVLPLVVTERHLLGTSHIILRPPYNKHTVSIDFLLKSGYEKAAVSSFLQFIRVKYPNLFLLELDRIPDWSPTFNSLPDGPCGFAVHKEFHSFGSIFRIDCNFAGFQARLSSGFKKNLRRMERRLADMGEVTTVFLAGKDATGDGLDRFLRIEGSGWKGERGSAISRSDSLIDFYRILTARLSELGWLEWHFLMVGGKDVAAHLAIRMGRSLTLFKIGYDQAYADYAPGNILIFRMLERNFTCSDLVEINCLMYYHWNDHWRIERNNYYNLYFISRRPLPLMTRFLPLKVRELLRRVPGAKAAYHSLERRFSGVPHRSTPAKGPDKRKA